MKKQALTLAIAAALSAPSALAAQDTSGMHFTSAAEGFYASIRAVYEDGKKEDSKGIIDNSSSRIGVRGTNDLGGGMEGFYQWEGGVALDDGGNVSTRLAHVGLRGAFGQVQVGSFWPQDYNWVHVSTDVANASGGNFIYNDDRPGRTSNALEYTTPDLSGFKGALRVNMAGGTKGDENIDAWNIAGTYAVQGFTMAATYGNRPNALKADAETAQTQIQGAHADLSGFTATSDEDDRTSWSVHLGYAQDNWYVNGWYGAQNTSDEDDVTLTQGNTTRTLSAGIDDSTVLSFAGGVTLDKVSLYGIWEQGESSAITDATTTGTTAAERLANLSITTKDQKASHATLGAQYNLGAKSRVWLEYVMRSLDSDKGDANRADDSFNVGLRHDF